MLDFMTVATKYSDKDKITEVFPKFIMQKSKDLMIRGRDFYAIWDEERHLWSTDEDDVVRLVDRAMSNWVRDNEERIFG